MPIDLSDDPRRQNALNAPRYRGVLHTWCVPIAVLIAIVIVVVAPTTTARILGGIYGLTVVGMFAASATFHRGTWTDDQWWTMRKVDQTAIYVVIAGSYTGMAGLALTDPWRMRLLIAVWIGTAIGVAMVWLPFRMPFGLNTAIYVALGALVIPRLGELWDFVGSSGVTLILTGMLLYFFGALALGARFPDLLPGVFGYHEVWHTVVTLATVLHWSAVLFVIFPALA